LQDLGEMPYTGSGICRVGITPGNSVGNPPLCGKPLNNKLGVHFSATSPLGGVETEDV
jgi:hypothetical protein